MTHKTSLAFLNAALLRRVWAHFHHHNYDTSIFPNFPRSRLSYTYCAMLPIILIRVREKKIMFSAFNLAGSGYFKLSCLFETVAVYLSTTNTFHSRWYN